MEQTLQSSRNGVEFRQPTFNRDWKRFCKRIYRSLEWYGRSRAARTLSMHGYHEYSKNLLEGRWS